MVAQAGFSAVAAPQFNIDTALIEGAIFPVELSNEHEADVIEFRDGWSRIMHTLALGDGMSVTHEYGDTCEGIASSQQAGRNTMRVPITSARMSIKEMAGEPWMRARETAGAAPTQSQRLMCCDGLLVKGLRVQVSVMGKYNKDFYPCGHDPATTPAFNNGVILSNTIILKPLVESSSGAGDLVTIGFPFTSDAGAITVSNPVVKSFRTVHTQGEYSEFQLTLEGIAGNTETFEAGSAHLLIPSLLLQATIDAVSAHYSLERIIELNEGRPAKMTEIVTIFPDVDYPDGIV